MKKTVAGKENEKKKTGKSVHKILYTHDLTSIYICIFVHEHIYTQKYIFTHWVKS
jgi:hypothetical protein